MLLLAPCGVFAAGLPSVTATPAAGGGTQYSLNVQVLLLMTLLTVLPALLLSMTAFTRIVVVLGLLRQALGTNQPPSNQILVGLAMLLSFFVMSPVMQKVYEEGPKPYMDGTLRLGPALAARLRPLRGLMQTGSDEGREGGGV